MIGQLQKNLSVSDKTIAASAGPLFDPITAHGEITSAKFAIMPLHLAPIQARPSSVRKRVSLSPWISDLVVPMNGKWPPTLPSQAKTSSLKSKNNEPCDPSHGIGPHRHNIKRALIQIGREK